MKHSPTAEQSAILAAVRSSETSLMISAMAGCAKTTTLEMLARELPLRPTLALAFNKKIATELAARLPKHFSTMTLNGLGHRAWARTLNIRLSLDSSKLFNIIKEVFKAEGADRDHWSTVSALVRGARQVGLVPQSIQKMPVGAKGLVPDHPDTWEAIADAAYIDAPAEAIALARAVLHSMIIKSFAGTIDFDDQIYMPTIFNGIFPSFSITLVDEAQDLSPLNHRMIGFSNPNGRLIVCGDPHQAIYAFRGADSNSMENLRGLRPAWIDLPLSLTFRCPSSIVTRQQSHAPGFTAAKGNPPGTVRVNTGLWGVEGMATPMAILCRNNAPLISAALRFIRSGTGVTYLGNDIGKALIAISKKILPLDNLPAEECEARIRAWETQEVALARANGKESRVAILRDQAACLMAVLSGSTQRPLTSGAMRETLSTMFARENVNITLSTIHRAKGLEWPTVVHLEPQLVPSKWAKREFADGNPASMQQELNLRYVAETRTQHTLILAQLEDLLSEEPQHDAA